MLCIVYLEAKSTGQSLHEKEKFFTRTIYVHDKMLCTINEATEKKAPPGRFEPEKGSQDDALPLTASSAQSEKHISRVVSRTIRAKYLLYIG